MKCRISRLSISRISRQLPQLLAPSLKSCVKHHWPLMGLSLQTATTSVFSAVESTAVNEWLDAIRRWPSSGVKCPKKAGALSFWNIGGLSSVSLLSTFHPGYNPVPPFEVCLIPMFSIAIPIPCECPYPRILGHWSIKFRLYIRHTSLLVHCMIYDIFYIFHTSCRSCI